MKKRDRKFLKRLLETPSVTGSEATAAELVRERLAPCADTIETDVMGSVHAVLKGAGSAPSVMLAAHIDEIGLMVTYISTEGFLSFSAVGGVDAAILAGLRVTVHTASGPVRGVIGRMPIHLLDTDDRKSVVPIDKLVIDLGLPAKKVRSLVRIGDVATFGTGFERFGAHKAVSRGFDDKTGVWVAVRALEELARGARPQGDFICAATVQEEIGTRGATTTAFRVNPAVGLAFDVTHATDYPGIDQSKHGKLVCGKGPVISRGPNINPVVFERLVAAAEAEGIPYQIEAEPGPTGTDARAIQIARSGIAAGLIGIPLRYMHTPSEVADLRDLEAAVALVVRFVRDLDENVSFVPGMEDAPCAGKKARGKKKAGRKKAKGTDVREAEACAPSDAGHANTAKAKPEAKAAAAAEAEPKHADAPHADDDASWLFGTAEPERA